MAKRRTLLVILGVAALFVLAPLTGYIIKNPPAPPPSEAAKMALVPSDIGANWYGQIQDKPNYPLAGNYLVPFLRT